ncbi:ArnT family glycosyltransferase [Flexithrix dorotheae]|uniref:ArnT family glycosyltransferase n=1 Tax=Flexithrix dorotheae TaxID=70993 RepID=UPI00047741FB|nr:glycosyltransferase family 39 protein [Flexithrix dorotheae]
MNRKVLILFGVCLLLFTANIWDVSVYILDESKNAACAREMMESGSPIVPTFNYELRTDKPPLHYYFMMAGYSIFGKNEMGARIFSSLAGVLAVFMTFWISRIFLGEKKAFYAALVLVSSLQLAVQFHLAVPDPYLICLFVSSLFVFLLAYTKNSKSHFFLFYALMGLAVLTKGPMAIVLPGGIIFFFLILKKDFNFKSILRIQLFPGLLIFFLVVIPWYWAVGEATDWEWPREFFLVHNIGRFTGKMEGHGGPFFLPTVFVIAGLLPFSVFIFQALHLAWKDRNNDLILFSIIGAGVVIIFFSISKTKLPSYPEPSFPFLAILLGNFMAKLDIPEFIKKYKAKASLIVLGVIAFLLPVAVYIAWGEEADLRPFQPLSALLIGIPIGTVWGIVLFNRGKTQQAFFSVSGGFVISGLILFYAIFPKLDNLSPIRNGLAKMDQSKAILHYRSYNPAFSFYIHKEIEKLGSPQDVQKRIDEGEEFFLISRKNDIHDIEKINELDKIFEQKDLFELPYTVILHFDPNKH